MPRGRPRKRVEVNRATQDSIEERLTRCSKGDMESIIHVGDLVERTMKGEFGAVLKALTAGRISTELSSNRDGKLSADRVLGRCEMADLLWQDLEQYVLDKDKLLEEIAKEPIEESLTTF